MYIYIDDLLRPKCAEIIMASPVFFFAMFAVKPKIVTKIHRLLGDSLWRGQVSEQSTVSKLSRNVSKAMVLKRAFCFK